MLFVAAIFGGGALVVACIGAVLLLRRHRVTDVVLAAGGSLVALVAAVFIVAWLFSLRPHDSAGPAAFKGEFRFPPPDDVRHIRSYSYSSTDSDVHYLAFRAQPSTIIALTRERFKLSDRSRCGETEPEVPAWWTPPTAVADCYVAQPFDHAFQSNRAWLTYDVNTGETRYVYVGID